MKYDVRNAENHRITVGLYCRWGTMHETKKHAEEEL